MDFEEIEKSSDGTKRTVLYFAHPYCASERGINENHNRMCRRFYPKGTDFQKLEFRYLGRMLIFFICTQPPKLQMRRRCRMQNTGAGGKTKRERVIRVSLAFRLPRVN